MLALVVGSVLLTAGTAPARPASCPSGIKEVPASADELGYRQRENRCEGRMAFEPYGQEPMRIVGFTETFVDYPLSSGTTLDVAWSSPPSTMRIEARSLARHSRYRMDAVVPTPEKTFRWPLHVLASLKYRRNDLAVIARSQVSLAGRTHEVLVPLKIGLDGNRSTAGTYRALVVPGVSLRKLTVSLAPVRPDGTYGPALFEKELRSPFQLIAHRAIEVLVGRPREAGIYALVVGGKAESSAAAPDALRVWFYNP